jgi:putative nucleotidyltransferase with HDIG domain
MISRSDALALVRTKLGTGRRYEHSLAVAKRMGDAAAVLKTDAEEWYLTGLLHDIDLELTKDDMARHGVLARAMLEGLLPPEALLAIEAHDDSTGVRSDAEIAKALRFADTVENTLPRIGVAELRGAAGSGKWEGLMDAHPDMRDRLRAIGDFLTEHPSIIV